MSRKEADGASAVERGPNEQSDDETEPIDDPETYLGDDVTLAEFERAVAESGTVLEIQRETRLPRWKVKRLLHHTEMRDEIASTAQRVAALRDDDG